jgi:hypothetical protein
MLAPGKIYYGTVLRLTATFVDGDGTATNPDTVTLKTYSPSGTETSYVYGTDAEMQRPATGSYTGDITPDEPGRWFYRWETTGDGTTITNEGAFNVQDSPFYSGSSEAYS